MHGMYKPVMDIHNKSVVWLTAGLKDFEGEIVYTLSNAQ